MEVTTRKRGMMGSMLELENLAEELIRIRDEKHYSDEEMAEYIGLSLSGFIKIVTGTTNRARRSTLRRIAENMDCDFVIDENRVRFVSARNIDPDSDFLDGIDDEKKRIITAMIEKMRTWRSDQWEAFEALVRLVDQKTNQHQEGA